MAGDAWPGRSMGRLQGARRPRFCRAGLRGGRTGCSGNVSGGAGAGGRSETEGRHLLAHSRRHSSARLCLMDRRGCCEARNAAGRGKAGPLRAVAREESAPPGRGRPSTEAQSSPELRAPCRQRQTSRQAPRGGETLGNRTKLETDSKERQDQPQDRNGEKDKIVTGKKGTLQSTRGRTDFEESSAGATQGGKTQKTRRASAKGRGGVGVGKGRGSPCTPVPRERARQGTRGPGKPPKAGGAKLTLRGI